MNRKAHIIGNILKVGFPSIVFGIFFYICDTVITAHSQQVDFKDLLFEPSREQIGSALLILFVFLALVGLIRYVNYREHKTERKIAETNSRYRELFFNIPGCIVVLEKINDEKDFKIIDFNVTAEFTEQKKSKDVLGKQYSAEFKESIDSGLFDKLLKVYETRESDFFAFTEKSDEGRIVSARDYFIYNVSKDEVALIYFDVTDQRETERKLRGIK